MKLAMAKSVAQKLEELNDVLETTIQQGRDVSVRAVVPNRHAERRVKSTLHEYPVYVELQIASAND